MSNYKPIFLEKATNIHQGKYVYDQLPVTFTYAMVVPILCRKHGLFNQKARTHATGSGCQRCAHELRRSTTYDANKHTKDQFVSKARKAHGDWYDYTNSVYLGQMKKISITCPVHGVFIITANNHIHGTGCSKCKRSRGETIIQTWLDKHNIPYETQKTFKDLILPGYKKLTNRPKYDFYLPSARILIEFDGKQHFEPVRFRGIEEQEAIRLHQRTVVADEIKNQYATNNGFLLVRINYRDIKKIPDILSALIYVN